MILKLFSRLRNFVWACVISSLQGACNQHSVRTLGIYSPSGKTSYRKISWSLEAARFGFNFFQSLRNLAGTSAALLPRCLSNFRAIRPLQHPIPRLRYFTRFGGKTSYRLVNRGPVMWLLLQYTPHHNYRANGNTVHCTNCAHHSCHLYLWWFSTRCYVRDLVCVYHGWCSHFRNVIASENHVNIKLSKLTLNYPMPSLVTYFHLVTTKGYFVGLYFGHCFQLLSNT